jgi:Uma2 family endonuclease
MEEEKLYTADYIFNLPDGERAELLDGKLYNMDMPGTTHQRILSNLLCDIYSFIEQNKLDYEILTLPFVILINNDNLNCVSPDISVVCDKSKLTEITCNGAPDWIIEIVAPPSIKMDYFFKLFKYVESGVREYWIVDPSKEIVRVYSFEKMDMNEYTFKDKIKAGIYEDLEIDFANIGI